MWQTLHDDIKVQHLWPKGCDNSEEAYLGCHRGRLVLLVHLVHQGHPDHRDRLERR